MVSLGRGGVSYERGTPLLDTHNACGHPQGLTGVPRSHENANPWNLTAGLCLGPDDGPRRKASSHERTSVLDTHKALHFAAGLGWLPRHSVKFIGHPQILSHLTPDQEISTCLEAGLGVLAVMSTGVPRS